MMKRFFAVLFVLTALLISGAAAEGKYAFSHPAYAGLADRKVSIGYSRLRNVGNCELQVIGENGELLGKAKVKADTKYGVISVQLSEDMPREQKIQLVLNLNGETEWQDECILAVDDRQHEGLKKVETTEKKIAVTFDTAMGLGKTYKLLDLLDQYNVKCTFFVQGEYVFNNPEAAREIHNRGHELANHSVTHPNMPDCDETTIYREINSCNRLIEEVTGKPVTLYRPPSGYYTYRDRAIGRALGCEMVLWTFDSQDGFKDASEAKVWKRMNELSEPGAIILMHVYGKYTLDILDRYLPMMQENGYEFVTVTDLMLPGGVIDKEGVQRLPEAM